jgi:hypothetical protein
MWRSWRRSLSSDKEELEEIMIDLSGGAGGDHDRMIRRR